MGSSNITNESFQENLDFSGLLDAYGSPVDGSHHTKSSDIPPLPFTTKSSVVPGGGDDGDDDGGDINPNTDTTKPPLDDPLGIFKGFDPKTMGIVALIGIVLGLMAKVSSDFWSARFNEASEVMNMQADMGPIMAKAEKANWDAQAKATKDDAWTQVFVGVISLGMAGIAAYTGYTNPIGEVTENLGADLEETSEAMEEDLTEQIENTSENEGPAGGNAANTLAKGANFWDSMMKNMLFFNMLNGGLTAAAQAVGNFVKAGHQKEAGRQAALEKIAEQYAGFLGQYFQRTQDQVPEGQKSIDYAMNLLMQISKMFVDHMPVRG